MEVLKHLIYEYKKGIRPLILHTMDKKLELQAVSLLSKHSIEHRVRHIDDKVNIFFGDENCLNVIESFKNSNLNKLEAEEDFILGILLGYDKLEQCKRYLKKVNKKQPQKTKTRAFPDTSQFPIEKRNS